MKKRQIDALSAFVLAGFLAHAAVADDPAGPSEGGQTSGIEIGFMNGVHEDLDSNLQPIRQGSITIRVSSPDHRLTVHGNRLTLEPRSDGSFDAVIEVDFEGRGHLIADVETIGRFEDRVQAPRQTARAEDHISPLIDGLPGCGCSPLGINKSYIQTARMEG